MLRVRYLVMPSVAVFPNSCALNSTPVMSAAMSALQKHGFTVSENCMNSDIAMIWSVLWSGRMAPNQHIYQHYRQQGRPVIILEVGSLLRNTTWKVCLNNINAQGFFGHCTDLDLDRPKKLDITLGNSQRHAKHVLIALQHEQSLQLKDIDYPDWIANTIKRLRTVTDRPCVLRPHPRSRLDVTRFGLEIDIPKKIAQTYDSFDIDYKCHAVINYNSGVGVQAALSGTRVCVDHSSLAREIAVDIDQIDSNIEPDRAQWLIEICHTEWLREEIEQGIWVKRLGLHS